MLDHSRLRIGTVEDRDFVERDTIAAQGAHLVHDEGGLIQVGERLEHSKRLALGIRGPEILAQTFAVVADQGVCRIEDMPVRAVILLEPDHALDREVPLEVLHIRCRRSTEGIDRLVVIADREDGVARFRETLQPAVLQPVRVLEFVDQDMLESRPVVAAQRLVAREQLVRAQQELCKIDHAFALALLVVGSVNVPHAPGEFVVHVDLGRTQTFLLAARYEPLHLARRETLLVRVEALQQALDHGELVLGIENLEQLRQARLPEMRAQHAVAQPMKRADPHAARVDRQHGGNAREHLLGGLVGERHGHEPHRAQLPGVDQPRRPCRKHARLAAPGAGEHERRLARQRDRLELLFVETGKKAWGHAGRDETRRL